MSTLLVVIGFLQAPSDAGFSGNVIRVSDGDTITLLRDWTLVKFLLHEVDCPESGQEVGSRAKSLASELAFSKDVTVRPRDVDRNGRSVAGIALPDGRNLGHKLVWARMAWWFR